MPNKVKTSDFYTWQGSDLILRIWLQPKASRDEFVGAQEDRLKIRLTAPPADGQANRQLIAFLAKEFKVPKMQIVITHGELARQKALRIAEPKKIPEGLGIVAAV